MLARILDRAPINTLPYYLITNKSKEQEVKTYCLSLI